MCALLLPHQLRRRQGIHCLFVDFSPWIRVTTTNLPHTPSNTFPFVHYLLSFHQQMHPLSHYPCSYQHRIVWRLQRSNKALRHLNASSSSSLLSSQSSSKNSAKGGGVSDRDTVAAPSTWWHEFLSCTKKLQYRLLIHPAVLNTQLKWWIWVS